MSFRSLYVHVPFCLRRCPYCDFAVVPTRRPPWGTYLRAVAEEALLQAEAYGWATPVALATLYFGGGTPSLLPPGAFEELVTRLRGVVSWNETVEWTVEANPETVDAERVRTWRRLGVTRVSLGVQTFHGPALRRMGRLHGADGAVAAARLIRRAGIPSLSIDLLFALPVEWGQNWEADLDRALALEPDHISLYGLAVEPNTPLARWVGEGRVRPVEDERYADQYLRAHERLRAAGYRAYEVSNFARPGHESRHNWVYWSGAPYGAVGPGAHAYDPPVRRWNLRDWVAYCRRVFAGRLPLAGAERVPESARRLERIWLALRTDAGLPLAALPPRAQPLVARWRAHGWAEERNGRLTLTPVGWLLLDRLAVELSDAAAS